MNILFLLVIKNSKITKSNIINYTLWYNFILKKSSKKKGKIHLENLYKSGLL